MLTAGTTLKDQILKSGEILSNDLCKRVTDNMKVSEKSFFMAVTQATESAISKISNTTALLSEINESTRTYNLNLMREWKHTTIHAFNTKTRSQTISVAIIFLFALAIAAVIGALVTFSHLKNSHRILPTDVQSWDTPITNNDTLGTGHALIMTKNTSWLNAGTKWCPQQAAACYYTSP